MSVAETVRELKSLNLEIKSRNAELKSLRSEKKRCEEEIISYLNEKEQPGIKVNDFVVMAETKDRRTRKKKSDKERDGEGVLSKYGVENPKKVLAELLESMRGEKASVSVLKTKDVVQGL